MFAYNDKYCIGTLYTQQSRFSQHKMMLHKLKDFEFMQMFKDLLTASFPMTCKGSCFSFVHTMWELLPPHYVTSTDVPVVAVLPLSDSRINNTSYQLRRVHSSAHGRRVCTVLSFSQISQTHSLVIRFQLCCSFSFSLTWLSLYLKSF